MSAATYSRLASLLALLLTPAVLPAQSSSLLRSDSHTWSLGLNGGAMLVRTQTQDAKALPAAGAHLRIMANRTALIIGVDEIFGKDEEAGLIRFNDIRRYQALLIAHPFSGPMEPYLGVGGGIMQVVHPQVAPLVTDPSTRAQLQAGADDAGSFAMATAVAGLQGRWGRFTVFGQYQIGSVPASNRLLSGVTHSVMGGIRIGLGRADEDLTVVRD